MFQTFQRMNFRLCANVVESRTQLRVYLKRQKIVFGKFYSSSRENSSPEWKLLTETENKNVELTEKQSDKKVDKIADKIAERVKKERSKYAEINPRITRIDKREFPTIQPKSHAEKRLMTKASQIFESTSKDGKNLETFVKAVDMYNDMEKLYKRGFVEFIDEGMNRLKDYGLEKNLDAYKMLLLVFPKEELKAKSAVQVEFMHYPKQQQCAIDLMDKMEGHGLIPDAEFGEMLLDIFHPDSHSVRKYMRIMYWLPKFRNANPYPVPYYLPDDEIELAVIALKRMAFDINNKTQVWKTKEMEENPIEDTFIVSAQSPKQQELIEQHPVEQPLFVEGAYDVYLRSKSQSYFILRADPKEEEAPKPKKEYDEDLFENWRLFFEDEDPTDLVPVKSVHEQDNMTILGMCITGTGSKDSLVTWIRYLQKTNHKLEKIPIVFSLKSPLSYSYYSDESSKDDENPKETIEDKKVDAKMLDSQP